MTGETSARATFLRPVADSLPTCIFVCKCLRTYTFISPVLEKDLNSVL